MFDVRKSLIPYPQTVSFTEDNVLLAENSKPRYCLHVAACDHSVYGQAVKMLRDAITAKSTVTKDSGEAGAYPIYLSIQPDAAEFQSHARADAYAITVTKDAARLTGYDAGGIYYAVVTLMRLLHAENHRLYLPIIQIVDWPDFSDRGLFIEDRYGSDFLTREEWFDAVDYYSKMKLNQLTVGIYGCWCQQYDGMISEYLYVPFKKYPQLVTPRHVKYYSVSERKWIYKHDVLPVMFEDDYLGDLIAYAKTRNVKIKPLFNSYGHNTLLPRLIPEISAKDADGNDTGFGICPSGDATYEVMFDIYDEIIDRYLTPNGIDAIQLGMDEIWDGIGMDAKDPFKYHTPFCQCAKCRERSRGDLMVEYIIRLCKYLKKKGMKSVYIYYDMLFNDFNVLNEDFVRQLKDNDVYDVLVIDWWNYSSEDKLFFGKQINSLFRSIIKPITGYYHWSTPTEYTGNIHGCARLAKEMGYEGIESYSSHEYCFDRNFWYQAELSWNINRLDEQKDFFLRYACMYYPDDVERAENVLLHMQSIMSDNFMSGEARPCELFRLDYYMYTYVKKDLPYPRKFPDEVFERILEQRDYYLSYFRSVAETAKIGLDFFNEQDAKCSDAKFMNRTWRLIALHFYAVANEYLGILEVAGMEDASLAVQKLDQLIIAREQLMRDVENDRIKATQYTYLRNMSIYRQFLLDLRDYANTCAQKGCALRIDLTKLENVKSATFEALR